MAENKANFKNPLNIKTTKGNFKTLKMELDNKLSSLKEVDFINDETQFKAKLARTGINEIISSVSKSAKQGFKFYQHFAVAMDLKNVFKRAHFQGKSPDTKHGDPNVTIYRFTSPVLLDNEKQANALLTLKEWREDGKRLYALKLEQLEKKD